MQGDLWLVVEERKLLNEFPEEIKANDFNKIISDILSLINWKTIEIGKS